MIQASPDAGRELLMGRLVRHLEKDQGMSAEAACQTAQIWLGVVGPVRQVEPAERPTLPEAPKSPASEQTAVPRKLSLSSLFSKY